LARRNRLIQPVAASFVSETAGAFRARTAKATGRAKDQDHQAVKAAVKREARFRLEPVNHNQRVRA